MGFVRTRRTPIDRRRSCVHGHAVPRETFQLGALKVQDRKIQDWKTRGTENAELENVGPNRRGGKGGTGKRGNIMCMGSEM